MEVDKTPVRDETGPDGVDFYPEASRSLASLRHMRLMALLHDMIDAEDGAKAAAALGVSYRTVSRAVRSGKLTDRMANALERHLLQGGGSAAARQRERVEAVEKRLAGLELELRGGLEALVGEVKAMRDEHARAMRYVERRLVRLESGKGETEAPSVSGREPEQAEQWHVRRRQYPQLVTEDAEPGEEQVYGDATSVIVEWRTARDAYLKAAETGTEVDIREAQLPMLELEIGIIEKHELTLPPASSPWGREERMDQARERRRESSWAREERRKALLRRWVRRVLTLGLWRK